MNFEAQIVGELILVGMVLLWARWSRLDLGLHPPALRGSWPWILLFIAWCLIEWAIMILMIIPFELSDVDPDWLERMQQLSLIEELALTVLLAPVFEELLFRGAMFSALIRRWGIGRAVTVPSILWGVIHIQYEWWFVASIAGSGMILGIIRWKTRSLYVPLALHGLYNLLAMLIARTPAS